MTLYYANRRNGSQFTPNGRPVENVLESVAGEGLQKQEQEEDEDIRSA